jgi:hypothetical protein
MKERTRVGEDDVGVPLAARSASRTSFEGAESFELDCMDARTGASIRGSSMVGVVYGVVVGDGL